MAKKPTSSAETEFTEPMKAAAERSLVQARKAVNDVLAVAQKSIETMDAGASTLQGHIRDVGRESLSFAESTVDASLTFIEAMTRASSPQEIAEIQQKFVREQMERLGAQTRSLGENAIKTAQNLTKPFES